MLTAGISAAFLVPIARKGTMSAGGGWLVAGLMWSPGIAALVTRLLFQGDLGGVGWRWGKTRYHLLSIGVPFLVVAVTYAVAWLTGLGGVPDPAFVEEIAEQLPFEASRAQAILIYGVVSTVFGLATNALTALGEEIGWRGLLVPEVSKLTGPIRTGLMSGIVWAVWHYPGILLADYRSDAPVWYSLVCFTVMAVGLSVFMAWIRLESGSVWSAVFAHAAHNLSVQTLFTLLTADTGPTEYVIDEFGAGLALAYAVVAFFLWNKLLSAPQEEAPRGDR